jgi:nitroreductase
VVVGVIDRTAQKYGTNASRYVALEAGHAAQNLCLQAVGVQLGAVTIGALDENVVARALPLLPGETPYYLLPVGFPTVGS